MHDFQGCGGERPRDGELRRHWRGVTQRLADRYCQLGNAEQELVFRGRIDFRGCNAVAGPRIEGFHRKLVSVAAETERTSYDRSQSLAHPDEPGRLLVQLVRRMGKLFRQVVGSSTAISIDEACAFQCDVEHWLQRVVK